MVTLHGEHQDIASGTAVTPLSESAAALAVIVLAVLGLLNVTPGAMLAIATIVVGAAIVLQGAAVVAEYSRWLAADSPAAALSSAWGGGVTLDFVAGCVGIILGILALFANTAVLTAAALIVFGGTLLLGGAVTARQSIVTGLPATQLPPQDQAAEMVAAQISDVASGAQVLIGIAAIVLGILAFIPAAATHGQVLTLVGLLAVGASVLVTGMSSGGLLVTALRR
jgi:hypothetical protein